MNPLARGILWLVLVMLATCPNQAKAQAVERIAVANGKFIAPDGLAVDSSGNVFVTDLIGGSVEEILASGGYVDVKLLGGSSLYEPAGVAIDAHGNLFVTDQGNNEIKEILAPDYATIKTLPVASSNFDGPSAIAIDASGNLFITDVGNGCPCDDGPLKNAVVEVLASGGYATAKRLGPANFEIDSYGNVAIDQEGNVFLVDFNNSAVAELVAPGYSTVKTLPVPSGAINSPSAIERDNSGNLFIGNGNGSIVELLAATGYSTAVTVVQPYASLSGLGSIARDASGNLFVTVSDGVAEIHLAPSPLAAAILPGSRSVAETGAATVFATMINAAASDLQDCGVSLTDVNAVLLSFQTTDPSTNAPIGNANQRVAIAAHGSQTFLLSFSSQYNIPTTMPAAFPEFGCAGVPPALAVAGVDTVDLRFAANPTADVIALAATSTNDGTVHIANNVGAFAVATTNAGAAGSLIATTDTGSASLPLTAGICQTDSNAACLAAPAASVPVNFAGGAAPTFSIFLNAGGTVPFAPATSRIFVRFKDGSGVSYGSTSVAVTTN